MFCILLPETGLSPSRLVMAFSATGFPWLEVWTSRKIKQANSHEPCLTINEIEFVSNDSNSFVEKLVYTILLYVALMYLLESLVPLLGRFAGDCMTLLWPGNAIPKFIKTNTCSSILHFTVRSVIYGVLTPCLPETIQVKIQDNLQQRSTQDGDGCHTPQKTVTGVQSQSFLGKWKKLHDQEIVLSEIDCTPQKCAHR